MANSYIDYTGNGSLITFTTPPYLEKAHIIVAVDGVIKTLNTDYSIADNTNAVVFGTAPVAAAKIRISRSSSPNQRLTDYNNASLLTADAMDRDANQLFFLSQEAVDSAERTDFGAQTFYSSGTTDPSTAETGDLFFNSQTGFLKVYNGSAWFIVNALETKTVFTAPSSGERTFTTSATLGTNTFVFLNGVKLIEGILNDYTLNGDSVLLTTDDPSTAYVLEVINR
jgi:hypothetical protein